jgi:hypothetical protein
MSDIVLVVARCATCAGHIKGYAVEGGGEQKFVHVTKGPAWKRSHTAVVKHGTAKPVPADVFHAIPVLKDSR